MRLKCLSVIKNVRNKTIDPLLTLSRYVAILIGRCWAICTNRSFMVFVQSLWDSGVADL